MQVTSANAQDRNFARPVIADCAKREEPKPQPQPRQLPAQSTVGSDARQERGVIRLLEEGHFRGVADVRLRINFFSELSAKAEQQAAASLPDHVGTVRDQTVASFNEVVSTLGLDEDGAAAAQKLAEDFATAVNSAGEASVMDGQIDRTGLDSRLREAFSTLVTGLRELAGPRVAEEPASPSESETAAESTQPTAETGTAEQTHASAPVESPEPIAGSVAGEPTGTDPFASLVKVFEDAVAGLQQTLTAGLQLPELRPPQNNGGAYEKFIAMYNNLLNPNEQEPGETSSTVEISA